MPQPGNLLHSFLPMIFDHFKNLNRRRTFPSCCDMWCDELRASSILTKNIADSDVLNAVFWRLIIVMPCLRGPMSVSKTVAYHNSGPVP
jgi:hypothetical protein